MVVKVICYLNGIVYSFIANIDAVNFFAPFSCYIDSFSYAFLSFEEIYFILLEEVIKVVGLTFSC